MNELACPDYQAHLRRLWKIYWRASHQAYAAWKAQGYPSDRPAFPPFPDLLKGLACGAKTRAGTPCKRTDLFTSGRCKFHGGMSTGPRKTANPMET